MHSLEHIIATYLRNDPDWKDEVIYWGPMGCLTGFYLILKGNRASKDIYELILKAFKSVDDVRRCRELHLKTADITVCTIWVWQNGMQKSLLLILKKMQETGAIFEYPKTERLVTDDGQHFSDS